MPLAVEYCTVTGWVEAAERRTVNGSSAVPVFPSLTRALETLRVGSVGVGGVVGVTGTVSSLSIVPVAVVFTSVAFVGALNFSDSVSFASAVESRLTSTVTVFCVSPGAKVSVPEEAV